ncbi:MAG TPA: hypothetical protein VGI30_07160, partial [Caulobacteraceae bacterium]
VGALVQGQAKVSRTIHRIGPDDPAPKEGVALRLHNGWSQDLAAVDAAVGVESPTEPTVHISTPRLEADELNRALAANAAAVLVLQLRGIASTDAGREARQAMENRRAKAAAEAEAIVAEAARKSSVRLAGGAMQTGTPAEAVKAAATKALVRRYPQFDPSDNPGWGRVWERAQRKDPDAMKAVDFSGPPQSHPVCKALLDALGAGRKGVDLRKMFDDPPYGWPRDAVDGGLLVLANLGQVRVIGEDGKPANLADLPRPKLSACTFRRETTVVDVTHRLAVRGLFNEVGLTFTNNQEQLALSGLLEKLEHLAQSSGGEAPAPAPQTVPRMAEFRAAADNDLLVALANDTDDLKTKISEWRAAARTIGERLPRWQLAQQLFRQGATERQADLEAIHRSRGLLADPDPVPTIIQTASETLRTRLNAAWTAWQEAWTAGEARLLADASWSKLTPDQRHAFRAQAGLLPAKAPAVETPEAIAFSLEARSLSQWNADAKAMSARIADALAEAAIAVDPKTREVTVATRLLHDQAELDTWLDETRSSLAAALANGPVIPRLG